MSDLPRSRAWYERVFDLETLTEFRDDEDGVVRGVSYRSKGDLTFALRENPEAAKGFAGFDPFAIMLRGRTDIDAWVQRLDELGVAHSAVIEAAIGYILTFDDPDGLQLRFYTLNEHGADPEGRVRAPCPCNGTRFIVPPVQGAAGSDGNTVVVGEPDEPAAVRSPCDVLRLVVAAVALLLLALVEWLAGDTLVHFAAQLTRGLDAVPAWLLDTIVSLTRVLAAVFIAGGFVMTVLRGRWRFLAVTAGAGIAAAALTVASEHLDPRAAGEAANLSGLVPPGFPTAIGLAATVAVVTAAAPWLSRRWRRVAWLLIVGAALSRFLVAPIVSIRCAAWSSAGSRASARYGCAESP